MCRDVYCSVIFNDEKPEIHYICIGMIGNERKWLSKLWSFSILESYLATKYIFEEYLITQGVIHDAMA